MGPQGPKGDTGDTGPKGDAGDTGPKGDTGATGATPVISMTATVDQTTGTPNVSVSKSGSDEAPSFNLAITGIKGEKGDKGDTGDQGPQGDPGPQGPAGADAEFPVGGTDGQSLVKDSDGYSWADMLPADGGTLTGNLAVDTGTTEPNVTVKRAVDGGSTAVEGVMRIDSDGVVGIRAKVAGEAVNNLYLEQTKTRLSKPLDVPSGGVPQDGSVGQILKKGASGAEWVDSIVVDAQDAAVAMRDSAAVVDNPTNPTSGIVLKTDDTGKTVISGIGGAPVDEVHVEDTTGDSTGTLAVNVDSMKAYVQDHAGDALPTGGTTGQVLTKTADGEAWQDAPETDLSGLLKSDFTGIEKLDANTVDISTLGPGTYLLSSVEQGTGAYNETLFPDAMVYGNPPSGNNILNVYGGFSGTGIKYLELFINSGNGTTSRYYARTIADGSIPSKNAWNKDSVNLVNKVDGGNTAAAVTGKAVADYVAANLGGSGGGGLELLWEGYATDDFNVHLDAGIEAYEAFVITYENNYPGTFLSVFIPLLRLYSASSFPAGYDADTGNVFEIANDYNDINVIMFTVLSGTIYSVHGVKASGGGA